VYAFFIAIERHSLVAHRFALFRTILFDYFILAPEWGTRQPLCILPDLLQFVKAGFAGSNFPAAIFPALVGRPVLRFEEKMIENVELKVGGMQRVLFPKSNTLH
jgi:hypothetical protein